MIFSNLTVDLVFKFEGSKVENLIKLIYLATKRIYINWKPVIYASKRSSIVQIRFLWQNIRSGLRIFTDLCVFLLIIVVCHSHFDS